MKEIPLTQNKVALVDDADYDDLSQHKWHARFIYGNWYALRNTKNSDRDDGISTTKIQMHRHLLQITSDVFVDHKDGNGLNNTRDNIRPCTKLENSRNKKIREQSRFGFKGIWLRAPARKGGPQRKRNPFGACIRYGGKTVVLGVFSTAEEAAKAYDVAALKYFGEFAQLNFPPMD